MLSRAKVALIEVAASHALKLPPCTQLRSQGVRGFLWLARYYLVFCHPGCGALMPSWAAISVARRPWGLRLVADFRHQPPRFPRRSGGRLGEIRRWRLSRALRDFPA
jgi:hypothetical protein